MKEKSMEDVNVAATRNWKPAKPFVWVKRLSYDNTEYADSDLGTYSAWEIDGAAYFFAPQGMYSGKMTGNKIDDAKRAAEEHLVNFGLSLIKPA